MLIDERNVMIFKATRDADGEVGLMFVWLNYKYRDTLECIFAPIADSRQIIGYLRTLASFRETDITDVEDWLSDHDIPYNRGAC